VLTAGPDALIGSGPDQLTDAGCELGERCGTALQRRLQDLLLGTEDVIVLTGTQPSGLQTLEAMVRGGFAHDPEALHRLGGLVSIDTGFGTGRTMEEFVFHHGDQRHQGLMERPHVRFNGGENPKHVADRAWRALQDALNHFKHRATVVVVNEVPMQVLLHLLLTGGRPLTERALKGDVLTPGVIHLQGVLGQNYVWLRQPAML
jgi:hypothetical protein